MEFKQNKEKIFSDKELVKKFVKTFKEMLQNMRGNFKHGDYFNPPQFYADMPAEDLNSYIHFFQDIEDILHKMIPKFKKDEKNNIKNKDIYNVVVKIQRNIHAVISSPRIGKSIEEWQEADDEEKKHVVISQQLSIELNKHMTDIWDSVRELELC